MTAQRATIVFAVLVTLVPVALAQVDWDRSVDFGTYHTFGFRSGTPANRLVQDRIETAVRETLRDKGLKETDTPELWVVTHVSMTAERWVSSTTPGYRGFRGSVGATSINVSEIPIGSLMIDLVDGERDELVWRGTTRATPKKSPEKSEKQIRKRVDKLFRDFPPQDKK